MAVHFVFSNEKVEHKYRTIYSKSYGEKVSSWSHIGNYSFINYLFDIKNIWSLISYDTIMVIVIEHNKISGSPRTRGEIVNPRQGCELGLAAQLWAQAHLA